MFLTGQDKEDEQDFHLADQDPKIIFKDYPKPIAFDEAQLSSNLFKALRVEIDKTRQNGQFLLSGSSSPALLNNISESYNTELSNFAYDMNSENKLKQLPSLLTEHEVFESCLYGGYSQPFLAREDIIFFDSWFSHYNKTYIERDVRSLFPTLKLESYRKFILMLAHASGNIINYSDFARSLDASVPTIKKYFEIAHGTFIWRTIPYYTNHPHKLVTKMPKGNIRDSGLLCYLLNINTKEQLQTYSHFGRIWESFVSEQIIKMCALFHEKMQICYYRTKAKAEIDLILEGRLGTIPIEIKSGISTTQKQLLTLKNFIAENNCSLYLKPR